MSGLQGQLNQSCFLFWFIWMTFPPLFEKKKKILRNFTYKRKTINYLEAWWKWKGMLCKKDSYLLEVELKKRKRKLVEPTSKVKTMNLNLHLLLQRQRWIHPLSQERRSVTYKTECSCLWCGACHGKPGLFCVTSWSLSFGPFKLN